MTTNDGERAIGQWQRKANAISLARLLKMSAGG